MKITWHGYSCFTIQGQDAKIVTDPFTEEIGLTVPHLKADVLTVSHKHSNHSNTKAVSGDPFICENPGEFEIKEVQVMGIPAFHFSKSESEDAEKRGKITIFYIIVDGIKICHLGDLGHKIPSELAEKIGDVDILLIPVGGLDTIGPKKAHQVIEQIEPKVVIPMHFKTEGLNIDLQPVTNFLQEVGKELQLVDNYQVKKSIDLPTETTEYVVLNVT